MFYATINVNISSYFFMKISGYRIDLNKASQQSTLRLPNGKVIHVRKQVPLSTDRNSSVRYSITTEVPSSSPTLQTLPTQPAVNQYRLAAVRPPPSPRSGSRPVQAIVGAQVQHNVPQRSVRPAILSRSVPGNIVAVRAPPPLIINSVSSGVVMPPLGVQSHAALHQAHLQQSILRQTNTSSGGVPIAVPPSPQTPMGTAAAPNIPLPRYDANLCIIFSRCKRN